MFINTWWNISSFAQSQGCECSTYPSLEFTQSFEGLFPPSVIKREGVEEVVISILSQEQERDKIDSFKVVDSSFAEDYIAIVLKFNSLGFVTSKGNYDDEGKVDRIWNYERNKAHKVSKETLSYLDRQGEPSRKFPPKIIDFTYDTKGRLIIIKERDYYGKILPDETSTFTKYEYDSKDKVVKEVRQYYYEGSKPSLYTTSFKNIDNLTSTYKTFIDGKLFITGTYKYNINGDILEKRTFVGGKQKDANEEFWQYDSQKRLIVLESKSGGSFGSECPDGGTYKDAYHYKDSGLVEKIIHTYKGMTCIIKFDYKNKPSR